MVAETNDQAEALAVVTSGRADMLCDRQIVGRVNRYVKTDPKKKEELLREQMGNQVQKNAEDSAKSPQAFFWSSAMQQDAIVADSFQHYKLSNGAVSFESFLMMLCVRLWNQNQFHKAEWFKLKEKS